MRWEVGRRESAAEGIAGLPHAAASESHGCLLLAEGGAGQFIAALVFGMPGMPFDPMPVNAMELTSFIESQPQVPVFDRSASAGLPSVSLPFVDPIGDAVLEIARVGVDRQTAGPLEGADGFHYRRQFHSIVGGPGCAAGEFLFRVPAT